MAKKSKSKKRRDDEEDEDEDIDDEDLEEDEEDVDDDEDADEEEDEEDEEKPRKKKSGKGSKASGVRGKRKRKSDDSEEEDSDDDSDDEDEDDTEDEEEDDDRPIKNKKGGDDWFSHNEKDAEGKGAKFKFEDGEEHEIEFLSDKPFVFRQHYIRGAKPSPYITCPGDGCPLDKIGNRAGGRISYYALVDGKAATVTEGSTLGKIVARKRTKYGSLLGRVFTITRIGKDTDTTWELEYKGKSKNSSKAEKAKKNSPDYKALNTPLPIKKLKEIARSLSKGGDDDEDF